MMENEKRATELNEQDLAQVAGGERIGFGENFSCTCPQCGYFIKYATMIGDMQCPSCGEYFNASDQAPEVYWQER